MYFVYKLDHLFKSTRVSNENSSVSKAFHFSKLISTQDFFRIQHATLKSTQKRLKLGMVSSFDTHRMCEKLRGLRQKLDALRVQTGPSLSKYDGFGRKLIYFCIRSMNGNISMCSTKHKVSPAYSPTVALECKHINASSDVCRESE